MFNKISFILFSVLLVITIILYPTKKEEKHSVRPVNPCVTEVRTSVTFIMGNDEGHMNNFYKNATYFYNMNPSQKTDFVVHSCQTLIDVFQYLSNNSNGKIFGTINIVCHGNPWQGLSVPIARHLPRANVVNLENALKSNLIKPLCSNAIDKQTVINIVSCGVGQNIDFSHILSKLFSCPENTSSPLINIESHFVNFSDKQQKRLSDFYFIISKYEYDDPRIIAEKLKQKYKQTQIDWYQAYKNEDKLSINKPYKHQFRMLVEWQTGFESYDKIPDLNKEIDIVKWLKTQNAAMTELHQMNLKPEDFMWHSFAISDNLNSIKIKGYANVGGVLVDITSKDLAEL